MSVTECQEGYANYPHLMTFIHPLRQLVRYISSCCRSMCSYKLLFYRKVVYFMNSTFNKGHNFSFRRHTASYPVRIRDSPTQQDGRSLKVTTHVYLFVELRIQANFLHFHTSHVTCPSGNETNLPARLL
jgi:hypothetical protein